MLKPEHEVRFFSVDTAVSHHYASNQYQRTQHSSLSMDWCFCCSRQRLSRVSTRFTPHHSQLGLFTSRKYSLRWLTVLGVFVLTSIVLIYQFWLFGGGSSSSLTGVQGPDLSKFKTPSPPPRTNDKDTDFRSAAMGPPAAAPVVSRLEPGSELIKGVNSHAPLLPEVRIQDTNANAIVQQPVVAKSFRWPGWPTNVPLLLNETELAALISNVPGNITLTDSPESDLPPEPRVLTVELPTSSSASSSWLPSLSFLSSLFRFPASPAPSDSSSALNFSRLTLDDVVDQLVDRLSAVIKSTMSSRNPPKLKLAAAPAVRKTSSRRPPTDAEKRAQDEKDRKMKMRVNGKRVDVAEESVDPIKGPGVLIPRLGKKYATETVHFIREGKCETSDCRALITGHGRSGTHFIAAQLMKNNISIFHEQINAEGSVSWAFAGRLKGKSFVAPKRDMVLLHNDSFSWYPVVFQTRHPLAVIISAARCFCGCGAMSCGKWIDPDSWKWAGNWVQYSNRLPVTTPDGRVLRAMEYFVGWAELVEKQAMWWYQMESVDLQELVDKIGFTGRIEKQEPFKHQRGGTSRNVHNVSWEKMRKLSPQLEAKIWAFAQRYGYGRDAEASNKAATKNSPGSKNHK